MGRIALCGVFDESCLSFGAYLVERGFEVIGVSSKQQSSEIKHWRVGTLESQSSTRGLFDGVDVVVVFMMSLAERRYMRAQEVEGRFLIGMYNLGMEASRSGVKRMIFVEQEHVRDSSGDRYFKLADELELILTGVYAGLVTVMHPMVEEKPEKVKGLRSFLKSSLKVFSKEEKGYRIVDVGFFEHLESLLFLGEIEEQVEVIGDGVEAEGFEKVGLGVSRDSDFMQSRWTNVSVKRLCEYKGRELLSVGRLFLDWLAKFVSKRLVMENWEAGLLECRLGWLSLFKTRLVEEGDRSIRVDFISNANSRQVAFSVRFLVLGVEGRKQMLWAVSEGTGASVSRLFYWLLGSFSRFLEKWE